MSIITDPWRGYGVTQDYGPTSNPAEPAQFGAAHFHDGIDFGVPSGTPVPSPFAGVIVAAGPDAYGYGIKVAVRDSDGYMAFYGHLGSVAVAVGQNVAAGTLLGTSDNTGNSTGAHLHVGSHTPSGGTLNPDDFPAPSSAPASTAVPAGASAGVKVLALVAAAYIGATALDYVFG